MFQAKNDHADVCWSLYDWTTRSVSSTQSKAMPLEMKGTRIVEADLELFSLFSHESYLAILVMSHMGRKIARAKKPTTAASPTMRIGPRASDIPLTA